MFCTLGALLPRCLTLCVFWVWFVASVVRAFERNDFFDAGITKAQLFLTVHDAVLFALPRSFPESSELSVDESETVIQETYSETDKVGWCEASGLGVRGGVRGGGGGDTQSDRDEQHLGKVLSVAVPDFEMSKCSLTGW